MIAPVVFWTTGQNPAYQPTPCISFFVIAKLEIIRSEKRLQENFRFRFLEG